MPDTHNGADIAAPNVAVVYHSGFGHTATLADAVAEGAREAGAAVDLIAVASMSDDDWDRLDSADAMIFGSPTYMATSQRHSRVSPSRPAAAVSRARGRTRSRPASPTPGARAATSSTP